MFMLRPKSQGSGRPLAGLLVGGGCGHWGSGMGGGRICDLVSSEPLPQWLMCPKTERRSPGPGPSPGLPVC